MAFTKAKIVMAGLAVTAVCIVAPQQLKAQVPEAQMDGVMGQSIEDETVYESKPDLDTLIEKNAPVFGNRTSLKKASSYSSAFLNASFTTAGDYTSATYYHKADYADDELVNGIDVSYWQADAALKKKYSKDKTKWTQTGLDWESITEPELILLSCVWHPEIRKMEVFTEIIVQTVIFREQFPMISMSDCISFPRL